MSDINILFPSRDNDDNVTLSIEDATTLVKSGDIVLISGCSNMSAVVDFFCSSAYSHVGIIYRESSLSPPLLFEAVRHGDDTTKSNEGAGVRMIDFHKFLTTFKGHSVAIRTLQLSCELENVRKLLNDIFNETIEEVRQEMLGRPYKTRYIDFFISKFRIFRETVDHMSSVFCSELVAYCYMKMGLIYSCNTFPCVCKSPLMHSVPCDYLPDDFSESGELSLLLHKDVISEIPFNIDFENVISLSKERFVALNRTNDNHKSATGRQIILFVAFFIVFIFFCIYILIVNDH